MQSSLRRSGLLAVVLLTVAIATSRPGRAADALWSVPGQAAAGVYLQEWSQFLWGLLASQTGTLPSWGEPFYNADGSISQEFSAIDGTWGLQTQWEDGWLCIYLVLADGTSQTLWQEPETYDGTVGTLVYHVTSSDGFALDYTRVQDTRGTGFASDDWMHLWGTGVLPNGLSQAFTLTATGGRADLESTQCDGSTYSMSVPLDPDEPLPSMLPDFAKVTSCTYTDATVAMEFTLTSTPAFPRRWAALLTDVEGGITATLSLNEDFSAVGQLAADGMLAALVCWTRHGEVQVCDLTGQNVQMGPAGAALDFLRHQWQKLTALGAPNLGANGPSPQFSRPSRQSRPPPGHWHRGMRTAPSGNPPVGVRRGPGRR